MPARRPSPGFTLIEALVVVAIIGVLLAVLLPTLAASRDGARQLRCAANLRHSFVACQAWALDAGGLGPAIGQPYAAIPNWALVVQRASSVRGDTPADLYRADSALVCPAADAAYEPDMVRTYAMNGTGHNRRDWNADPDNYDDAPPPDPPVAIRFDRVARPAESPLLIDAAAAAPGPGAPPPNRCASVVDFRPDAGMADRVGWFHAGERGAKAINAVRFDGSVATTIEIPPLWEEPLP